jgi:uncharacterized protein
MPNRLAIEKSPYLLQHSQNPVDWYPWGEEAFARARQEDKPIFLSIGYSTCHWCHVMARESFENADTAGLLNEGFIPIKVDREERPDVDRIYMGALQAMGISGGWPMSIFLTPDLKPFYGGTYFPPENWHERAGFPEILRRISAIWQHKRPDILESGDKIVEYLREVATAPSGQSLAVPSMLLTCYEHIMRTFDEKNGGFGGAPKFPRPVVLRFLARYFTERPESAADHIVLHTLRAIGNGGIRDHIGGGFHRYSVDGEWRVPHFEKMLYDQAQLARAYLEASQLSRDPWFASVAADTLDYVLRDLLMPEGGFASAEDADSARPENPAEHGEGAFYIWTRKEVNEALGPDASLFSFVYGVEEEGNVAFDPHHEFTNRNVLFVAQPPGEASKFAGMSVTEVQHHLVSARSRMFEARKGRARPLRDDKVIAGWNGMMIGALANASAVLGDHRYLDAATKAANFILTSMRDRQTGLLHRRYRAGEAKYTAQLQDYAFLCEGLIDVFEVTGDPKWLQEAVELTRIQIQLFWDEAHGGFYDTGADDASLLVRTRDQYDGAEPTGNSTAALNLARLSDLTGVGEFRARADATVKSFGPWLEKQPSIMPYLATAALHLEQVPSQIVVVGGREDASTRSLWHECYARFLPGMAKIPVDPEWQERLAALIPYAGEVRQKEGSVTAYVCSNFVCQLPVTNVEALGKLLDRQ